MHSFQHHFQTCRAPYRLQRRDGPTAGAGDSGSGKNGDNRKRKRGGGASGAGQHPNNAPTLTALQKSNAQGASRYFYPRKRGLPPRGGWQRQDTYPVNTGVNWWSPRPAGGEETPRTVPRAPLNTTEYLMDLAGTYLPLSLPCAAVAVLHQWDEKAPEAPGLTTPAFTVLCQSTALCALTVLGNGCCVRGLLLLRL